MTKQLPARLSRSLVICLALLLSGCMLVSGGRTSTDAQDGGGNLSMAFVSAEGSEVRTLATGSPARLNVIATVAVDRGDLRLELLDPDGAVVFSVESQPGQEIIRSGDVATDGQGQLRYRIVARDARNGKLQLLYQRR